MRKMCLSVIVLLSCILLAGCGCEHEYDDDVVTTEPTCVETGVKTYTCTKCGDSYQEELPLQGISMKASLQKSLPLTKKPTFDEEGVTTYTCSVCGDSYEESIPVRTDKVVITVYAKEVVDVDEKYADYGVYPAVFYGIHVENRTDKIVKGVKGSIQTYDMFGELLMDDPAYFEEQPIDPGQTVEYTWHWEVYPNDEVSNRIFKAAYEDLTFVSKVDQIVYADGSKDVSK